MMDARTKWVQNFPVDQKGTIAWFDVSTMSIASVQAVALTAWAGSPNLELVVANVRRNDAALLLATVLGSGTYEIATSAGMITAIDVAARAYSYIGLRVKTAGNSGDKADIHFAASSNGGGSGRITIEPPDTGMGL